MIALLTPSIFAAGQAASTDRKAKAAPAKPAAIKHLADGTPDIQGTWVKVGGGLNEANRPTTDLLPFHIALAEPQGFGQGSVAAGPNGEAVERNRTPKNMPKPAPPQGIV